MNRLIISILVLFGVCTVSCNNIENSKSEEGEKPGGVAVLSFENLQHDFGEITEGEKVACMFKFTNSGDGDLVINSATTSCGCTVPRFDKEPIPPNESGSVEVLFDSAFREGTQTKTITIRSNAKVKVVVLRIVAEVMDAIDK